MLDGSIFFEDAKYFPPWLGRYVGKSLYRQLMRYEIEEIQKNGFRCRVCGKKYKTFTGYKKHMLNNHYIIGT